MTGLGLHIAEKPAINLLTMSKVNFNHRGVNKVKIDMAAAWHPIDDNVVANVSKLGDA